METWIIVLLVVLVVAYLWITRSSAPYQETTQVQAIPPDVIEVMIEQIQEKYPDYVPVDTLYVNSVGQDTYSGRFMFFDSRHFFGTQIDCQSRINAQEQVLLSMTPSVQVDLYDAGFTPFRPDNYQEYSGIKQAIESELQKALKEVPKLPGLANAGSTRNADNLLSRSAPY